MAYDGTKLNAMVTGSTAGQPTWWSYNSTDAATVVRVADYISDALDRGMKAGDIVIQTSPAATVGHIYQVVTVDADGADLTNGTALTATNSD